MQVETRSIAAHRGPMLAPAWDYLILTATNEIQAAAYRTQLEVRRRLGLLGAVGDTLVVADPGGRRVGSGGSTICCLLEVINRRLGSALGDRAQPEVWQQVLRQLRILIIHAGGDSRRLPAYGPCGKVFLPLPGPSDSALVPTLFDRQLPVYLRLPPAEADAGQVVITSGDVLVEFSSEEVSFAAGGITGLGCAALPEQASAHGVYCVGPGGAVRRFLQKPSPAEQAAAGAVDGYGRSILDIGVIQIDAAVAVQLLRLCDVRREPSGVLAWSGPMAAAIPREGLDFYREICCALGTAATLDSYRDALRRGGSSWDAASTERIFAGVAGIPCRVQVLRQCEFLHFGTTRQIIASGQELLRRDPRFRRGSSCLSINNRLARPDLLAATDAWVEGCALEDRLTLGGENLVAGVNVSQALALPPQACLDVVAGRSRTGQPVHFIRCYRACDGFHNTPASAAGLGGLPLDRWMLSAGASPEDIWDSALPPQGRSAWNARLFPAESHPEGYRQWLWMSAPGQASAEQFRAWRQADRYSLEEMAVLVDQEAFHRRRAQARGEEIRRWLRQYFRAESGFSAADLAHLLADASDPTAWLVRLLAEARWRAQRSDSEAAEETFVLARMTHTLGTALRRWIERPEPTMGQVFSGLEQAIAPELALWLEKMDLRPDPQETVGHWSDRAHAAAFQSIRGKMMASSTPPCDLPVNALRSDEIVWGRAPARLDLAGGWTDTPPYALEHGGCVLNAAVELNGQPPIQVFARVTPEPVIRCRSIDVGSEAVIRSWEDLLADRSPSADFSLVKAALAISGFAPDAAGLRPGQSLAETLTRFGGGLELTTLAAIPKGSGLGTSSIMGAVLLAVIHRVLGRELPPGELFRAVLRLEQALTTGGGWQDQIGGSVGGLKLISTSPGLVPEATIRYIPAEILTPASRGGQVLLYYTGMTRLAKNILEQVVGGYLDRDRQLVAGLAQIRALAAQMAETVARRDLPAFGRLVGTAWQLNKQLDANSTRPEIEALLSLAAPQLYGAKLLGAGGGGFLLLVCKSPEDAARLRARLEAAPPNPRARFFEFDVADQGLAVSVC